MKDEDKTKDQLINELILLRQRITELERLETERKRAEEWESKYRHLFENLNSAAFLADAETGHIIETNKQGEVLLGRTREEIIGMHQSELHPPGKAKEYRQRFATHVEKGRAADYDGEAIRKDGSIVPVNISAAPLTVGGKRLIIGLFHDITERKQAEEALQKLYAHERKLRQELEAEAKKRAEFLRALVHELKTPLTPMLASSELLVNELQEEPLLSLARNINQGISRLNNRIDELLDLARGEMGMLQLNFKSVDPLQLLHKVAYDLAPVASSRRQSLTLALHPLPTIQADEERLYQVVLNLLNNASKFTPEGGEITLRAEEKDTSLIVQVQDSGRGIAKEEQQRLFDPYYRVERDRGRLSGLGLGLALCKTLVELHGGQLWVESCVDKGSTFSFSVPLEAARQQAKGSKMGK